MSTFNTITDTLFIPEFIYDTIVKTPSYMFWYTTISIIAFVVAFHLLFYFIICFLHKITLLSRLLRAYQWCEVIE